MRINVTDEEKQKARLAVLAKEFNKISPSLVYEQEERLAREQAKLAKLQQEQEGRARQERRECPSFLSDDYTPHKRPERKRYGPQGFWLLDM